MMVKLLYYYYENDNRRIYSLLSILIVGNDYYKIEVIRFILLLYTYGNYKGEKENKKAD